jgi:hypothetical protein
MVLGVSSEESVRIARLLKCTEGVSTNKIFGYFSQQHEIILCKPDICGGENREKVDCMARVTPILSREVYFNGEQFVLFTNIYNGGIMAS